MKTIENDKTSNRIELKFGKYITIDSIKSNKLTYEPDIKKHGEEYAYYGSVKDIRIFLNDEYIAKIKIDERGFNIIYEDYNIPTFNRKYKKELYDLIIDFLFKCHDVMKKSNKNYGTYDGVDKREYRYEGNIYLLVHQFFDFVENDYKNSKSTEVIKLKEFQKHLKLYLEMEKYNL